MSVIGIVYDPNGKFLASFGKHTVKVRVPQYHGLPNNQSQVSWFVPNERLPSALVIRPVSGFLPVLKHNDEVFVEFSNNNLARPIIVGKTGNKYDGANNPTAEDMLPSEQPSYTTSASNYELAVPAPISGSDVWSSLADDIYDIRRLSAPAPYYRKDAYGNDYLFVPNAGEYHRLNRGRGVSAVVIHYTACRVTSGRAVVDGWMRNTPYSSSNYIISTDGKITGVVPEQERAYTSSSYGKGANDIDDRAITIECGCEIVAGTDTTVPGWYNNPDVYYTTEATLNKCIELLADIGTRYGITWTFGDYDLSGTIHAHKWYDSTDHTPCPGPYLYERLGYIAEQANALMNSGG